MSVDGMLLVPNAGKAIGVEGPERTGLDVLLAHHRELIANAKARGEHLVLVFHPNIIGKDEAWMDGLFSLVEESARDDQLWIATCHEVADWIAARRNGCEPCCG
jgi:hypothetical protein